MNEGSQSSRSTNPSTCDPMDRPLVSRLADWTEMATRPVCMVAFALMVVVVFYEVVARYVFSRPTFWSEPLARMALVWVVLMGFSLGTRHREHIRIDGLAMAAPAWLQRWFARLRWLAALGFAAVLLVWGVPLAVQNLVQDIPGLEISVFWVYLAVPICAFFVILYVVEMIRNRDYRPF
jgi:TRAP-type C4-dicarboxylate transport system permease small subunit